MRKLFVHTSVECGPPDLPDEEGRQPNYRQGAADLEVQILEKWVA